MFASKAALVDNDELWMISLDMAILFKISISRRGLLGYYIIPISELKFCSYLAMAKCRDRIYIFPYDAEKAFAFNIKKEVFEPLCLPLTDEEKGTKGKFISAVAYKDKVLAIGYGIKSIFWIDIKSGDIIRDDTCYSEDLNKTASNGCMFNDSFFQEEEKLYLPVNGMNRIICLDIGKMSYEHIVLDNQLRIRTVYGNQGVFLLTTLDGRRVIWKQDSQKLDEKAVIDTYEGEKEFVRAVRVNNKNYYIPLYDRAVYVEADKCIRKITIGDDLMGERIDGVQFEAVFVYDNNLFMQSYSNEKLLMVDTEKDVVRCLEWDIQYDVIKQIYYDEITLRNTNRIIYEQKMFGIDEYLKMIAG